VEELLAYKLPNEIAICGFTGIIADMHITRFSVLSKAERYRTRSLNHQACKGEPPKDAFKSKDFSIKITLRH